jgi:hypothetical protein
VGGGAGKVWQDRKSLELGGISLKTKLEYAVLQPFDRKIAGTRPTQFNVFRHMSLFQKSVHRRLCPHTVLHCLAKAPAKVNNPLNFFSMRRDKNAASQAFHADWLLI